MFLKGGIQTSGRFWWHSSIPEVKDFDQAGSDVSNSIDVQRLTLGYQ
ncbi:hypothetical protein [Robertkochia solimangrovi]|nr:hypothetical protein [Robertkochia solimangrovi]